MEIYNPETEKSTKFSSAPKKDFFNRSELNDWMPLWEKIVFLVLGYIGFELIANVVYYFFTFVLGSGNALIQPLYIFFSYLLLAGCFCLFLFLDKRRTYQRVFFDFRHKEVYLYGLLGFVLLFAFQEILGFAYSFIPFYGINSNQSGIETAAKAQPILTFAAVVFFAPFCEELTYRVGLVDTIGHKSRLIGILISAVIFGFIHFDFSSITNLYLANTYRSLVDSGSINASELSSSLQKMITDEGLQNLQYVMYNEFLNLPIYMGSGAILGLIYAKSGKIGSSMISHCLNNLLSMISIFISASMILPHLL